MKRKKTKPSRRQALDPLAFMHQPHDKYARFVLQNPSVALELIQFGLAPDACAAIDLDSLELSEDSFIDARLRAHFSDICYTGTTKSEKPLRISIIFEHKSERSGWSALEQLNRYICNVWSSDLRRGRPFSLTIPILVYHGKEPIEKERPATMFPDAPTDLLPFVPSFDYVLLDIARMSDEALESLRFLMLRNVFLAFKHGRDEKNMGQNWKKIIIFAPELRDQNRHLELFQATIIYMSRISSVFNEKIEDMDNVLSAAEAQVVKPYVIRLYEEGMEKGIEKGMEKGIEKGMEKGIEKGMEKGIEKGDSFGFARAILTFLKKNPDWSDQQVAQVFEVDLALVKSLRASIERS
jgi:predicted transposase/invertase (TIGR01784 family)